MHRKVPSILVLSILVSLVDVFVGMPQPRREIFSSLQVNLRQTDKPTNQVRRSGNSSRYRWRGYA
jgi:hypothetical protein